MSSGAYRARVADLVLLLAELDHKLAAIRRTVSDGVDVLNSHSAEIVAEVEHALDETRSALDMLIPALAEHQRPSTPRWAPPARGRRTELAPVIDDVVRGLGDEARVMRRSGDGRSGEAAVDMEATTVRRAVDNVIRNAVRASGPTGRVVVSARRRRDVVELVVDDDGPGFGLIPRHSGIGLLGTIAAMLEGRGSLAVGPGSSGGTRVTLQWPAAG